MKQALRLAYRNLVGAGLRTWLNVGVLSFSFVVILFYNGLIDGWNKQARRDTIAWEYGQGQLINSAYDALDPFTIMDGHGDISAVMSDDLTPILIQQASIYPENRVMNVLMKGIDPNQTILEIPTELLDTTTEELPMLIGSSMSRTTGLKKGDKTLMQWRDVNGTFDAANVVVVGVFETTVPTVDLGQVYLPLETMWKITQLHNHATYLVANEQYTPSNVEGWKFKSQQELLASLDLMIETKKSSGSILYLLLLAIALLAIFDTQVLSIFRRQKEIGTYVALGMTRAQVVRLFTFEGCMYSILAVIVGAIWGFPLLYILARNGIPYPVEQVQDFGVAISDTMYPVFSAGLIMSTVILVIIAATIVSYLPARKISKMNVVDAIKGKLQ